MRLPRLLLIILSAASAGAAQARPPEALACAIMAAPPGLDARVADVVASREVDKGSSALTDLQAVVDQCAADQFMPPKEREAYFTYTLGRMARDVLDGRLAAKGLSSALIDKALDIGPGNANNPAEKVTEGDMRRVATELAVAGTDPKQVTPEGWTLVTAWIVATANMFDGLRNID